MTRTEATAVLTEAATEWLAQGAVDISEEKAQDMLRYDTAFYEECAQAVQVLGERDSIDIYEGIVRTWLGIMPALPLARGVPVVQLADLSKRVTLDDYAGLYASAFRVDLEDPQGFGYALCYFDQHAHHARHRLTDYGADHLQVMSNWLAGETTPADRIALARALAEVVG